MSIWRQEVHRAAVAAMKQPIVEKISRDHWKFGGAVELTRSDDGTLATNTLMDDHNDGREPDGLKIWISRTILKPHYPELDEIPFAESRPDFDEWNRWLTKVATAMTQTLSQLKKEEVADAHRKLETRAHQATRSLKTYNHLLSHWGHRGSGGFRDLARTHAPAFILLNKKSTYSGQAKKNFAFTPADILALPETLGKLGFSDAIWPFLCRLPLPHVHYLSGLFTRRLLNTPVGPGPIAMIEALARIDHAEDLSTACYGALLRSNAAGFLLPYLPAMARHIPFARANQGMGYLQIDLERLADALSGRFGTIGRTPSPDQPWELISRSLLEENQAGFPVLPAAPAAIGEPSRDNNHRFRMTNLDDQPDIAVHTAPGALKVLIENFSARWPKTIKLRVQAAAGGSGKIEISERALRELLTDVDNVSVTTHEDSIVFSIIRFKPEY